MTPKDILGQDLAAGDYIITGRNHGDNWLQAFEIIGVTPKGFLKLRAVNGRRWYRSQLQSSITEAMKISKDQAEKLKEK